MDTPTLITAIIDANVQIDLVAFCNMIPFVSRFPNFRVECIQYGGVTRNLSDEVRNTDDSKNVTGNELFETLEEPQAMQISEKTFKNSVTLILRSHDIGKEWVVKVIHSGFHICGAREEMEAVVVCDQIMQWMIMTHSVITNNDSILKSLYYEDLEIGSEEKRLKYRRVCLLPYYDEIVTRTKHRMKILRESGQGEEEFACIEKYLENVQVHGLFSLTGNSEHCILTQSNPVMINYVYKNNDHYTPVGRYHFIREIRNRMPMMREWAKDHDDIYQIKIKIEYACSAVHHGGFIPICILNTKTMKKQTIIIHVIKGSIVHSMSCKADRQIALEFIRKFLDFIITLP